MLEVMLKTYADGDYKAIYINGKPAFGYRHDDDPIGILRQLGKHVGFTVFYGGEITEQEMDKCFR